MKRGLHCILPVRVGCDADSIQKAQFVFTQGSKRLLFNYPSTSVTVQNGVFNIVWTKQQTMSFDSGLVQLDSHIHLYNTTYNPQTTIVSFFMNPTLFTEVELADD